MEILNLANYLQLNKKKPPIIHAQHHGVCEKSGNSPIVFHTLTVRSENDVLF